MTQNKVKILLFHFFVGGKSSSDGGSGQSEDEHETVNQSSKNQDRKDGILKRIKNAIFG